jgi:hypothetical protein
VLDPTGEAVDWVELYNRSTSTISTAGLHLSDDPADPTKWALPDRTLEPGDYLVIWTDERTSVGDDHASFKLEATGETVLLAYDSAAFLDQVTYAEQYPLYTWGRSPNGSGPFQRLSPTPEAYNRLEFGAEPDRALSIWPNPATTEVNAFVDVQGTMDVQVFSADGRPVTGVQRYTDRHLIQMSTVGLSSGHYILQVRTTDGTINQPFILLP